MLTQLSTIKMRPFWEIPVAEWDELMGVNVRGVWLASKAVVPHMRKQGSGRIVNISSGVVLMGRPNYLHYVASKGAVMSMTRAMAKELGDVLWYAAQLATELGLELEEIARENLLKLRSRQRRGMLSGSGDDR